MADSPVKPKSAMAAFMENKWVVSSLELITIILSIVSITSSVVSGSSRHSTRILVRSLCSLVIRVECLQSAYNKLRNAVVDLQSISDNWAAKPIYGAWPFLHDGQAGL